MRNYVIFFAGKNNKKYTAGVIRGGFRNLSRGGGNPIRNAAYNYYFSQVTM